MSLFNEAPAGVRFLDEALRLAVTFPPSGNAERGSPQGRTGERWCKASRDTSCCTDGSEQRRDLPGPEEHLEISQQEVERGFGDKREVCLDREVKERVNVISGGVLVELLSVVVLSVGQKGRVLSTRFSTNVKGLLKIKKTALRLLEETGTGSTEDQNTVGNTARGLLWKATRCEGNMIFIQDTRCKGY